jgi:hypothetical protein
MRVKKTKLYPGLKTTILAMLFGSALLVLLCPLSLAAKGNKPSIQDTISISITPGQVSQGNVAKITIMCPDSVTAQSYSCQDIHSRLYKTKKGFYSGLIPVAAQQKPGTMHLTITLQDSTGTRFNKRASLEVIPHEFDVQHLTIEKSKATLSKTNLKRHNSERGQVMEMFKRSLPERQWLNGFSAPVQGRISTPFGVKRFINKEPRNAHSGVDIAAPQGTPIKAAAAGKISLTGDHFFAGKSVYIDHGNETFSMYFHMDAIAVHEGQHVGAGDTLGHVGATGRATGPHLHWGVRIHGIPVDPFSLLALFEKE